MTKECVEKIAGQIYETNDYDIFSGHPHNREVLDTRKLEELMIKYGFLTGFPIVVYFYKSLNTHRIMDGHRRLHAARNLGIPVKYVIEKIIIDNVPELQAGIAMWSLEDYLSSGCKKGKKSYLIVREFFESSNIPLSVLVKLLTTKKARDAVKLFKTNAYEVSKSCVRKAEKIKEFSNCMKSNNVKIYKSAVFLDALIKVSYIDGFDIKRLQTKMLKNLPMVVKQNTLLGYIQMFEDIYNYRVKEDQKLDIVHTYRKNLKLKQNPTWFKKKEENEEEITVYGKNNGVETNDLSNVILDVSVFKDEQFSATA